MFKRYYLLFILAKCILISQVGMAQVKVGDAASAWLFEDSSGITAANSVIGGSDGTIYGDPLRAEGVGGIGQALDFDGYDDYIEIQNNPMA
jgi:hypothetical protein